MSSGFYSSREMDELAIEAGHTPLASEARCLSWLGTAAALSTRQSKLAMGTMVPINPTTPTTLDMAQLKFRLGSAISLSLTSVVRANELTGAIPTRTNFDCPPDKCASITVAKYIERLIKYTPTTPEVFMSALIYIDRLQKSSSAPVTLSRHNIHRVFAACFVVASKFQEDTYYSNRFYAKVAGLSIEELNLLEREVLWRLGFWLVIEGDTYAAYSNASDCLMQLELRYGDLTVFFRDLIKQLRACWALAAQQQLAQQQQLQMNLSSSAGATATATAPQPMVMTASPGIGMALQPSLLQQQGMTPLASPASVPATPLTHPALLMPVRQVTVSMRTTAGMQGLTGLALMQTTAPMGTPASSAAAAAASASSGGGGSVGGSNSNSSDNSTNMAVSPPSGPSQQLPPSSSYGWQQ